MMYKDKSEYKLAFREGKAIGGAEIFENIIKYEFKEVYDIYKYDIRRLCEHEMDEIFPELICLKDINIIFNYITRQ